ncbi:MAG: hypothetical protein ABJF11_01155 [Reichenbachiella sp.]|uniref:hypothetical protein n=1 Tax=Reichenbachiella sp. TaxID=2184521 RepID=UPI00326325A4
MKKILALPILAALYSLLFSTHLQASLYSPRSALEFQQATKMRIAIESNYIRFFANGNERMTLDVNGDLGLGTVSPDGYKLNVKGTARVTKFLDIGRERSSDAFQEGLFVQGSADSRTCFQLATKGHSGSHAMLFSAYKSAAQQSGNLVASGNTKFHGNAGSYQSGAAMIHYYGNKGGMGFYISEISTGADTDVAWGTPKLKIQRDGAVGINTNDPQDASLHVYRNATMGGWTNGITEASATLRIQDSGTSMYLDGNALVTTGDLHLGTRDGDYIAIATNSVERMRVKPNGNVGIGTTTPNNKLQVVGNIHANSYSAVSPPSWPDYVFEESYELSELAEVERFIETNHHLPEIPSAAEVKTDGVKLVEMQAKLLQKIEELTLYLIEQDKKLGTQNGMIKAQQQRILSLEKWVLD